jgi:hypothetical protein
MSIARKASGRRNTLTQDRRGPQIAGVQQIASIQMDSPCEACWMKTVLEQ